MATQMQLNLGCSVIILKNNEFTILSHIRQKHPAIYSRCSSRCAPWPNNGMKLEREVMQLRILSISYGCKFRKKKDIRLNRKKEDLCPPPLPICFVFPSVCRGRWKEKRVKGVRHRVKENDPESTSNCINTPATPAHLTHCIQSQTPLLLTSSHS